jgi:hypothetical protein
MPVGIGFQAKMGIKKPYILYGLSGEYRIRTGDLLHAMQALYQLS